MFNKITTLMIVIPIAILAIVGIYAIATNYGDEDESYKYNSQQVINRIQKAYPEFQPIDETRAKWSAEYDGSGLWFVTTATLDYIEPTLYGSSLASGFLTPRKYWVWWFNENDNKITGPWLVTPQEMEDKRGRLPYFDRGGLPRWE